MNDHWTSAGVWMLHTAVGGGLLLLMTSLLMRWTRQPARRQRLGEWGLTAALLVALGAAIGPSWLIISWNHGGATRSTTVASGTPTVVENVLPDGTDRNLAVTPEVGALPGAALWEFHPATEMDGVATGIDTQSWIEQASIVSMTIAALAAGFFALRLLLGYTALLRLVLRSEKAPPEVRGMFDAMAAGTRWVKLLVSQRLLSPLSCGLWQPTVVLPLAMCRQPAPRQLRWIFAHELTHLRRRDAWSALLLNLGQIFFFALPWYWWLRRQVRLCQEFVADAAAAGQDEENVEYAEFLLSLAGAPAVPVGASAVSGNCSDLYRRVTMLLNDPVRVETRCPRRWTLLVAGALMSLAVLVSGFGYRAEAAPEQQTVIIVRPVEAKGQAEKKQEVHFFLTPVDAAKIVKGEDVIFWRTVTPTDFDVKFKVKPLDVQSGEFKFVYDTKAIVIQSLGSKDQKAFVVQPRDDLAPLRNALKRLEELKKQGMLTNERMQAEVMKALHEMKAQPLSPKSDQTIFFEIVVPTQKDAKDKKIPQSVQSIEDLHKLLMELERASADLRTQQAHAQLQAAQAQQKAQAQLKAKLDVLEKQVRPPQRSRLGVTTEAINPALAEHLKLPGNAGLLVKDVAADSPADKAGIKANDILVKITGALVPGNVADFNKFLDGLKTGTPFDVVVLRKGSMQKAGSLTLPDVVKTRTKLAEPGKAPQPPTPPTAVVKPQPPVPPLPGTPPPAKAKNSKGEAEEGQWSKWGTLRQTDLKLDGKVPVYRLEDPTTGSVVGYAAPGAGLTLEPYVGKLVCLYGMISSTPIDQLPGDCMIVSQLKLP